MTVGEWWATGRRPSVEMVAPAERLAAFRVLAAGFTTLYLLVRMPRFLSLADRSAADFDPVGFLAFVDWRPAPALITALTLLTPLLGAAATIGWRHRVTAPLFAIGLLVLTTLRSSGGQLLHFENLMALFAIVLACSPAADAWSLDARRTGSRPGPATRYGHPLVIASVIVVVTYSIAGVAKLRYGGVGWMDGDTLRNHIASAAARLDLLGGTPAPLAGAAVRAGPILPAAAVATVVIELFAPVALIDRRLRDVWVVSAWAMHLGILLTMAIGFPSPLFGVAFAPLFHLEHGAQRLGGLVERMRRALRGGTGELAADPGSGH